MSRKQESSLQEQIMLYIRRKGGYVNNNWGSMISEPGIADLTVCYKGLYIAIEVKVGTNIPTPQQGIHCRKVLKANGISIVVWDIETVVDLLDTIDNLFTSQAELDIIKKAVKNNGSSY